jgi:putative hydrolase of HD superfamily
MEEQETRREQLSRILDVLHIAERLKHEMRHSWLSNGRQESVAEHTWRVAFMVIMMAPYIDQPVDIEKCLKLALLLDLAEAETGDIPVFENQQQDRKQAKYDNEQRAMLHIKSMLNDEVGQQIYELWEEYERQECYEAKFVRALDKLEAQLQHNEADLSTWLHREKIMVFQPKWMQRFCEFDSGLSLLGELIKEDAAEKLRANGDSIAELQEEAVL